MLVRVVGELHATFGWAWSCRRLSNFARNSLVTCSNIEITSLELQRFWAVSKNDRLKLRAKFVWAGSCRRPPAPCIGLATAHRHCPGSVPRSPPVPSTPVPPTPSTPVPPGLLIGVARCFEARVGTASTHRHGSRTPLPRCRLFLSGVTPFSWVLHQFPGGVMLPKWCNAP